MVDQQLSLLMAFHGILKAGVVFSPIHTDYTGENLAHQLNDCQAQVLIVDDRYVERINDIADDLAHLKQVVVRGTDDESESLDDAFEHQTFSDLRRGYAARPESDASWDDIATIIYTSGTTGMPKGVLHSHRQILVLYCETKSTFISSDDVVHNNLPLFHVGGLYGNILATLVSGGTVVCWDKFRTDKFWDRVDEYQASRAVIFSSMIRWLNDLPERETDHHNSLNKVTFVPLVEDYQEIADRFGFDIIDTYYGQTEIGLCLAGVIRAATGDRSTPTELERGRSPARAIELAKEKGIPVVDEAPDSSWAGKPVAPVEVTIVDDRDRRIAADGVGELVARPSEPSMIFHGYVNNSVATVDAWQNLWHHTGDALRYDESGNYYFVDRIQDVIRRRGENISTAQIEKPLKAHEGIRDVVAFSVPAVDGEEDDIAIAVKVVDGSGLDVESIDAAASEVLPRFMIPRYVRVVDELPTTETAKVEKYKLREQIVEEEGL
jgi:crotonobetaine/carnitine-CoA ligase